MNSQLKLIESLMMRLVFIMMFAKPNQKWGTLAAKLYEKHRIPHTPLIELHWAWLLQTDLAMTKHSLEKLKMLFQQISW